jgi:Uma2 family endonuclease
MTGGTPAHNQIAGNLFALLHFALQDSNYASFITDQRLWLSIPNIATYPDVMVIAEPITLMEGRKDTLMNPLFIAEVLSNTTESYDRTDKFAAYRTISTFKEYLLIAQDRVYVEHFHKQGEDWIFAAYQEATTIQLRHLMIEIRTEDLYRRVFK